MRSQYVERQQQRPPTTPTNQRLYSFEQVRNWCQTMFDHRLKFLTLQINENNETIRQLKQRLIQNDRELDRKQRMLQSLMKPTGTVVAVHGSSNHQHPIDLSRKLLSSQVQDKLATLNSLTRQLQFFRNSLSGSSQQTLESYQTRMDSWLNSNLNQMKEYIKKKCALVKQHNAQYWLKLRKWAVMFESRIKSCEGAVQVVYEEMGRMGEGMGESGVSGPHSTGKAGSGGANTVTAGGIGGSIGISLYRLKCANARFKEIEQAVADLQQGWKLATQAQQQLRDILWNNDQKDFADSSSNAFIDYQPQSQFQDFSPRKIPSPSMSPITSNIPQNYRSSGQSFRENYRSSGESFTNRADVTPNPPNVVYPVKKAISTQSTRPIQYQKVVSLGSGGGVRSLVSVEEERERYEADSSALSRQTGTFAQQEYQQQQQQQQQYQQQYQQQPMRSNSTNNNVLKSGQKGSNSQYRQQESYRTRELSQVSEASSAAPQLSQIPTTNPREMVYHEQQVTSSPKFGNRPYNPYQQQYHHHQQHHLAPSTTHSQSPQLPRFIYPSKPSVQQKQKSTTTFGNTKSIISTKPQPPSSPQPRQPPILSKPLQRSKVSESEPEPEPRGKSLTERATSLFCSLFGIGKKAEGEGKQEMKVENMEVDEMSVRPEPPSSPQRREERPVLINRDLAEPMTPQPVVQQKSVVISQPTVQVSVQSTKPVELSTSIKVQPPPQQQQSPLQPQPSLKATAATTTTQAALSTFPSIHSQPQTLIHRSDSFSSMQQTAPTHPKSQLAPNLQDLKTRLTRIAETDRMALPIACYLDDYKFLKTSSDLYLFDVEGDMIRMPEHLFRELCEQGVLRAVKGGGESGGGI